MNQQMLFIQYFVTACPYNCCYNNIKITNSNKNMDLSQYKMIRTKKFPLPHPKPQANLSTNSQNLHTMALISAQEPQYYQIIQHKEGGEGEQKNCVIMFNQHEYIKREFGSVYRLKAEGNGELVGGVMGVLEKVAGEYGNNLVIFNALDLTPIQQLIFPWREYISYNSDPDKNPNNAPKSALQSLLQSTLSKKRPNSIITLSVIGIRSDGSLEDELNYQWIEESKYIEDLVKIKEKTKLKVKKYKSQIKIFDLNRQQIKQWSEAQQILYHYSQIKQYLQCWKQQLEPGTNPKIGQLYQICQLQVDQDLGHIKQTYNRKLLLKLHQFMPQSNLVIMKLTQLLKQRIHNIPSVCTRDMPLIMFMRDCFEKEKNYHYTLLTQLGTNQSLKEEAICLNMDLQFPGLYVYLKNYCDRPDIIEELKCKARNFVPLTQQQRSDMKVATMENGLTKIKPKSLSIVKQSEAVVSKSFFYETYSSNEKKKPVANSNTFTAQTVLEDRRNTFQPYHDPKSAYNSNRHTDFQRK